MELAFAGLHQLCVPVLGRLESLPVPQREALRTAFGISAGPAPDRFLVGLAVLNLLSEAAAEQALLCVVDDAQWLDRASAQVLGFVARRLAADPVAVVFAARKPGAELAGLPEPASLPELAGLPELAVNGLRPGDARALLDAALAGPLDARVRDQIVAETRGNPLALLELPRGLTSAELAGFRLPGATPLAGRIEASFLRQLEALPDQARRLLQLAAADPTGDPLLVWRAAGLLGLPVQAAVPAAEAGLAEFGVRVRFRHPLLRSAAYLSAPFPQRQRIHAALAEATDPQTDPDRRAWHRAHAAAAPDEGVAAELERSAGRAQARGGLAAAAAFLERAMILTPDPNQRGGRALAAARAAVQAGALESAPDLLAMAEAAPLDEVQQANVSLVRAQLAFAALRGSDAPPLLLQAAKRLEPYDAGLSRSTYMDALIAAVFAGRLAGPGGSLLDVARAAGAAPSPPHPPRAPDLLLDGLVAHFNQGYAVAVPMLRKALRAFSGGTAADMEPRWLSFAYVAAAHIWDDEASIILSDQWATLTRQAGALSELPLALFSRVYAHLIAGELVAAASVVEQMQAAIEATGSDLAPFGALGLAALRGSEADTSALIEATLRNASQRGQGFAISVAEWASAVLNNGLGRYAAALTAAQRSSEIDYELGLPNWAVVELIEAAARSGTSNAAAGAYRRLAEMARAAGTDWALGLEARSHALLSEGAEAERLHREAIERLRRTRVRAELARAHLLYGEWLRRERRRGEAREQLRTASQMLEAMGMAAFAERARRELLATGETIAERTAQTARPHTAGTREPLTAREALTAQEAQVARLARDGLSNPEIGARLFISPRTVQYHLSKVFTKLGISSRGHLHRVLPGEPDPAAPR
jgi:DNA-binding CsgD family transcriptional regulator